LPKKVKATKNGNKTMMYRQKKSRKRTQLKERKDATEVARNGISKTKCSLKPFGRKIQLLRMLKKYLSIFKPSSLTCSSSSSRCR